MDRCVSGKRMYPSQEVAEEVLIESWTRYHYSGGNGPISVYQCDDCGQFHLTSRGIMNKKLADALQNGKVDRQKEANKWAERFKRR